MVYCPVCTIAVAGGAGLCRWLGIDDVISGVWIGGLLASLTAWIASWLERKSILSKAPGVVRWLVVATVVYLPTIIPLYGLGVAGGPHNTLYGVDRLLVGIFLGTITLLFGNWFYSFLKRLNGGKVLFPFQKVVIPVLCLVIISGVLYLTVC